MTLLTNDMREDGKSIVTWKFRKGISFLYAAIALIALYYVFLRQPMPEIMWSDFISILPYLIVASISSVFALLDLYERFPDFGVGLPLKTSAGWLYLFVNAAIATIVLFGYLKYLPVIGDVWTTSVTIAFTYPMLIRSKFFTITAASGEKISAGPEMLFDRVQTFLVNETLSSTGVLETRRSLIKACSETFGLATLTKEAILLIENRTDWDQEKRDKEKEKIKNIESSNLKNEEKEYQIAKYILLNGGEDYLREMTREITDVEKKKKIERVAEKFTLTRKLTTKMFLQRPEFPESLA